MPNPSLKELSLSPEELNKVSKLLAKEKGMEDYECMFENNLLSALKASESKTKTRTENIREVVKELQHKFSKSKINVIKRNLYRIENKKSLSAPKKTEKYLLILEENLSKLKKYYDYDDVEYKGIKGVRDFFDSPTDEDHYKPIIINGTFNNNYIQYESRGNKDKILTVDEYLDIIRPYVRDMINDNKTQSEWKIQLTIEINFISSEPGSGETRIMRAESDNVEIMMDSETDEITEKLFKSFKNRYQEGLQKSMKGVILLLIVLIYCIMIFIR